MEDQKSLIETLLEKTEHYTKTSTELLKLRAIEKSSDVISTLTAQLAIIIFIALFFLTLNIAIALWIGEILGRYYYGFFIIAGVYAVSGILLYTFRNKWIKVPVRNSIIIQALK